MKVFSHFFLITYGSTLVSCLGKCQCSEIAIGVVAQSTLGGHDIFARKICMKN